MNVGDEDRREGGGLPGHVGRVERLRRIEAGDLFHEVQGEVVSKAEPVPRLEELDEVLFPEVEWRPHVEPDSRVAVLDKDLVPTDFRVPAVEREFRSSPASPPRLLRELRD